MEVQQITAAEMERMMKLQDVLLKAMARKITWWAAAEIIGVSDRTMRRWRKRLEKHGYSGLGGRRQGEASLRGVPLVAGGEDLEVYRGLYFDLKMRDFHGKLGEKDHTEMR